MTSPIEQAILGRPQSRAVSVDDDGALKSLAGQAVDVGGLTPEQDAKLTALPDAAALSASLAAKIGTDKLGAASGVAELDSTGKLKASQIPASALVDVSATGANLSAGVLTFTQDEGGPAVTVDLNSFATDAELTAGLAGKASTAQGAKADAALQPGALPAGTTVTASQISDAGAAGRTLLQKATLTEIQALVSGVKNLVAGIGDSMMAGSAGPNNAAYSKAARHASNAWQDAGNFAVGGTRTDQIFSQFALAAAKGARIAVADGGTNDLFQFVSEATLRTNWIANVTEAKALGFVRYIDVGMPPTNVSAAMKTAHAGHELWRMLYCFKRGIQHVDIWSPFATASGGWQSGYNVDNTHWSSGISKIAGDRINAAIKNPVSGYPQLLAMTDTASDVGTYVGNAISYAGQSGATAATGWYHTGTGGTYSITAPDSGDFGAWYRCTMSGGTNAGMGAAAVTLASLGWAIGDRIAIGVKMRWVDVNGAMPLRIQINGITPDHQPMWGEVGGLTGDDIYLYDEMTINAGTAIGIVFTGTGTGYFEINRPVVVNLTKLGLA